jgi:hypothetical protein
VLIDFSPFSLKALDEAVEFSRRYEAELILLFVVGARFHRERDRESRATCHLSGAGDPDLGEAQASGRHSITLVGRAKDIAFLRAQDESIHGKIALCG